MYIKLLISLLSGERMVKTEGILEKNIGIILGIK